MQGLEGLCGTGQHLMRCLRIKLRCLLGGWGVEVFTRDFERVLWPAAFSNLWAPCLRSWLNAP